MSAPGGTPSSPSPALVASYGAGLTSITRYVELLVTDGVRRGLIGPREHDRIWDRHIANSAALTAEIPAGAVVVDIGSGAGLPGIPLAVLRPDLDVTLLEPMQRRVDFLLECVATLGLHRVVVRRGRAPQDLVAAPMLAVARAVAPLVTLIGATRPLLDAGGVLLALKGRAARTEMDTVRRQKIPVQLELVETHFADQSATIVRVCRSGTRSTRPALTDRSRS